MGNHLEKQELENFVCQNQYTKPDLAKTKHDPARTVLNPAGHTLISDILPYRPHLHLPTFSFYSTALPSLEKT